MTVGELITLLQGQSADAVVVLQAPVSSLRPTFRPVRVLREEMVKVVPGGVCHFGRLSARNTDRAVVID